MDFFFQKAGPADAEAKAEAAAVTAASLISFLSYRCEVRNVAQARPDEVQGRVVIKWLLIALAVQYSIAEQWWWYSSSSSVSI